MINTVPRSQSSSWSGKPLPGYRLGAGVVTQTHSPNIGPVERGIRTAASLPFPPLLATNEETGSRSRAHPNSTSTASLGTPHP